MPRLISAAFATDIASDGGGEIVYLPVGTHDITPTVNGEPGKVTVHLTAENGEQVTEKLNADLATRHGENVRPWFDFEHKRGAASALPQSFRFDSEVGIIAIVEWTDAGAKAIGGKDYSYFSPEFNIDDDGVPCGLPERGPIGGLVNEPAFREIPRIAASDNPSPAKITVMKSILAALNIDPDSANAEAAALRKIRAMDEEVDKLSALEEKITAMDEEKTKLQAEYDELKAEKDEIEAKAEEAQEDHAEKVVEAAIADGRIAPKDKTTAEKFRTRIAAGDAFAEEALGMLPKTRLADPVKKISASSQADAPEPTGISRIAAALAEESAK